MAVDTVDMDELEGVVTLFIETPFGMMTTSAQFLYCSWGSQATVPQPLLFRAVFHHHCRTQY